MKYRMIIKHAYAVDDLLASVDDDDVVARDNLIELLENFVRHGEYITIEFDTKENTAKVLPL